MCPVVVTRQFYACKCGGIGCDPSLTCMDGRLINRRCLLVSSPGTVRGNGWIGTRLSRSDPKFRWKLVRFWQRQHTKKIINSQWQEMVQMYLIDDERAISSTGQQGRYVLECSCGPWNGDRNVYRCGMIAGICSSGLRKAPHLIGQYTSYAGHLRGGHDWKHAVHCYWDTADHECCL